ncbi:MAG: hypothetical protein KAS32_14465 [Candidatus Peribacteraceae bacterium]|nr:hypothetical protein [Candidatus Peribacteraceae bacterium]
MNCTTCKDNKKLAIKDYRCKAKGLVRIGDGSGLMPPAWCPKNPPPGRPPQNNADEAIDG